MSPSVEGRVVVLGDVIADVVACLDERVRWRSDTSARIRTCPGGAAANTAAWLAGLGVPVTLVARRGDDLPGRYLEDALRSAGVDARLAVDASRPTGTLVSLVAPDGERSMVVDRGANDALDVADVIDLAGASALYVSGYALLHPGSRAAARHAIATARAARTLVLVDPASAAPLADVGAAAFRAWTSGIDVLLPNTDEAEVLTGDADPERAARRLGDAYPAVVVTCGARGAVAYAEGRLHRVPAVPVTPVDTTGAGDAYAAGLLAARLAGAGWPEAMAAAAHVAAGAVSRVGAQPPEATTGIRSSGRPE